MQAEDHDRIATRFSIVVDAVSDWDAATPVPEWSARDVVHHLTTWLPHFLAGCGVEMGAGDVDDPVGSWRTQTATLSALLATRSEEIVTHPFLGTKPIADLLAQVYLDDVFMHTWDLARAAGLDDHLDPAICEAMVTGMEQMEDVMRGSGHYGPRWPGDPGPDPQRRLLAFIGRDPDWRPPAPS